jgi:hypothetical protein
MHESKLDWSKLPDELQYLRQPAETYGVYATPRDRGRLEQSISEEQLAELARLAKRVRAPDEQGGRIWEWRQRHVGEPEEERVKWLIVVLNEFVPDFEEDARVADWGKLPPDLSYLAEPAAKYGPYWLDEDRTRLLDEIDDEELFALAELSNRVRSSSHREWIAAWMERCPPRLACNVESRLVHFLLNLMDELLPERVRHFVATAADGSVSGLHRIHRPEGSAVHVGETYAGGAWVEDDAVLRRALDRAIEAVSPERAEELLRAIDRGAR